jgi:hypothetical protein
MLLITDSNFTDVEENIFDSSGDPNIITMAGTSDYAKIAHNTFNIPTAQGKITLLGDNTLFYDNLRSSAPLSQIGTLIDASGTMTGIVGAPFTYERQSGTTTQTVAIDNQGTTTINVTYPSQYPTGGATMGGYPTPQVWFVDATATDFSATLSITEFNAKGFTIAVNVESASTMVGANVKVAWKAELL